MTSVTSGNDKTYSATTTTAATTVTSSSSPVSYMTLTRWHHYLLTQSPAYRELHAERERGWTLPALDNWYAMRRRAMTTAASTTTEANTKSDAAQAEQKQPTQQREGADVVREGAAAAAATAVAPTSAFAHVDVLLLSERYREHMRRLAHDTAPRFFRCRNNNNNNNNKDEGDVMFLDLGCAPGGVSKFLTLDLHWRGVGVTLATRDGGIGVDEALTAAAMRTQYALLEGNVAADVASWRCYTSPSSSSHDDDSNDNNNNNDACTPLQRRMLARLQQQTYYNDNDKDTTATTLQQQQQQQRFAFVNGGAVRDYGQRYTRLLRNTANKHDDEDEEKTTTGAPRQQQQPRRRRDNDDNNNDDDVADKNADDAAGDDDDDAADILPWLGLFVPQLRLALTHVADGGTMMLVYGLPQCASFFILLYALDNIVGDASCANATAATGAAAAAAPVADVAMASRDERRRCERATAHAAAMSHKARLPLFANNNNNNSDNNSNGSAPPHASTRVMVYETMHVTKPPVYILWCNVHRPENTAGAVGGSDTTRRRDDAQRQLLDALTPTSTTLLPVLASQLPAGVVHSEGSSSEATATTLHEALSAAARVRAKRQLWMGESDVGFALAQAGFARHRHAIEAVWRRARNCLCARRARAEREMAAMTAQKEAAAAAAAVAARVSSSQRATAA